MPVTTNKNNRTESDANTLKLIWQFLKIYWRGVFIIIYPILLLPIILLNERIRMFRCLYVFALMSGFWMLEVLPITVTAMFPLALFPLMGILNTADTTSCYINDTIMMFIGSLLISIAVEHCSLHNRVALWVIKKIGCSPRRILFGIIMVTAAISMWISNTAATSMMIPIVDAILTELEAQGISDMYIPSDNNEANDVNRRPSKMTTCYFICTAYAAGIGGFATLVGTGTNLVFKGIYEETYNETIKFAEWMIFAVPISAICLVLVWIVLQVQFMGLLRPKSQEYQKLKITKQGKEAAQTIIEKRYTDLGLLTGHQISVALLFILALLLWTFRQPPLIPGWPLLFTNLSVKDSTAAFIIGCLLFLLPSDWKFVRFFNKDSIRHLSQSTSPLLPWKTAQEKMPWGLLFLLGGGFALSRACKDTGLNSFVGEHLNGLKVLSPISVMLIFALVANILTEFTSNMTLANILLPILAEISKVLNVHPLFLMIPATLNCSMAFMMPAGTPPNAVVAGFINLRIGDLIKAGLVVSIITYLVTNFCFLTFGLIIFDIPSTSIMRGQ